MTSAGFPAYDRGMRYAQRGGYTPAEQQRRERLRLQAAGRFARGDTVRKIAHDLRVTEGSVRRWYRAWRDGGAEALRSMGPVLRERLGPRQWAQPEAELKKGPLAHETKRPGGLFRRLRRSAGRLWLRWFRGMLPGAAVADVHDPPSLK